MTRKSVYFRGSVKIDGQQIPWESVFPIGTRFSCSRCALCCYSAIELTEKDVQRFKENKLEDSVRKIKSTYASRGTYFPKFYYYMKNKRSGPCVKLNDKNLCSIYKLRPLICRTYPMELVIGLENNLVVDLALRCPFVNKKDLPKIDKKSVKNVVEDTIDHASKELLKLMDARNTLAKHVRYTYSPAFIEPKERLYFMDKAIEILAGPASLSNLMDRSQFWCDAVSDTSHGVIVRESMGLLKGRKQSNEILRRLKERMSDFSDKESIIPKRRWKRLLEDIGPGIFNLRNGKLYLAEISLGRKVKIGNLKFSYEKLEKLRYNKEALNRLQDYLSIIIRSPSFQLCFVMAAEYALEFKNRAVVNYELESGLISNAIIPHLDILSRVFAVLNNKDKIDGNQIGLAISNFHSQFYGGLVDGTLLNGLKKEIDKS